MKLFNSRKKIVGTAIGLVAVAGIATGAVAYFTAADGSSAGTATVGTSTAWSVSGVSTTGGPLYPGSGTETVHYTVTNPSAGHQYLGSVKVTVDQDGNGDVIDSNTSTAIAGCKQTWFAVSDNNPGLGADIVGGGTYTAGTSTITLPNLTTTDQSPCKNASFAVTVTASSN